jgi:hypothetical protein
MEEKPSASDNLRVEFIEYLPVNGYYEVTIKDVISYLDKYVIDISGPRDIFHLFSKVKRAKRHVILSVRLLLNYYETLGINSNYLDILRKAIPRRTRSPLNQEFI